jgi:spore coat polysaccharide biosynthesis predicted glycosyltransferase SpsG
MMLAKTLLNAFKGVKVDVAVRSHHPDLEALQALVEQSSGRLELATEPQEIVQKLTRCHLAIAAGNGWSMDLACLGVPQILIVQQECFWPSARRLEEEGAATCLGSGENLSVSNLKQVVQDLLDCPLERQAMSRCARQLIDGRGPDRLILALEVMLHPYRTVQETARAA